MPEMRIGDLIKGLRENQNISQAELAEGITERGYLSKIENNKAAPHRFMLDELFNRLGYNPSFITHYFIDAHTAKIQTMKQTLNAHLLKGRLQEAEDVIAALEADEKFMQEKLSQQYILRNKASLASKKKEDADKIIATLLEAIKISVPAFDMEQLGKKYLLTHTDIDIINLIAVQYHNKEDLDKAVEIMYALKNNMDMRFMDAAAKGAIYPRVIYNLTKYLGMTGRYHEAIKLCDEGKEFCLEIGAYGLLPLIIFNKATCLYEVGEKDQCRDMLSPIYYTMVMFEEYSDLDIIKNYALDKFSIVL